MPSDYRNTAYCPNLSELKAKKDKVVQMIAADHPRARDMHTYISQNDKSYKDSFMEAYNRKCAYCGVSLQIIPRAMFEIDHVIYEKSPKFSRSKANAGYIDNLVLACHFCNHSKQGFEIPDDQLGKLHPDSEEITNVFVRDETFYIQIDEAYQSNQSIQEFYKKINFSSELHRIDYLLMNMMGLVKKMEEKHQDPTSLHNAIRLLQTKRNIIG